MASPYHFIYYSLLLGGKLMISFAFCGGYNQLGLGLITTNTSPFFAFRVVSDHGLFFSLIIIMTPLPAFILSFFFLLMISILSILFLSMYLYICAFIILILIPSVPLPLSPLCFIYCYVPCLLRLTFLPFSLSVDST